MITPAAALGGTGRIWPSTDPMSTVPFLVIILTLIAAGIWWLLKQE